MHCPNFDGMIETLAPYRLSRQVQIVRVQSMGETSDVRGKGKETPALRMAVQIPAIALVLVVAFFLMPSPANNWAMVAAMACVPLFIPRSALDYLLLGDGPTLTLSVHGFESCESNQCSCSHIVMGPVHPTNSP